MKDKKLELTEEDLAEKARSKQAAEKAAKRVKAATNSRKGKLWKRILTLLFIALNIAIIAWTAISEFGNQDEAAELSTIKINWWFMIPAALCFITAVIIDVYKYVTLIRGTCGKKVKDIWKIARRTVFMGKYYDNITPAAVGGQPFQIYYMKKSGIPNGYDAIIPITGMITTQIGFIIIALLAFALFGWRMNNPTLLSTGLIGLIFYAFFPVAILTATFFPKATARVISWGVKLFHKFHIVKDQEKAIHSAEQGVLRYAKCIRVILSKDKLALKAIGLSIIYQLLIVSMPFFVLLTFGGQLDFFTCLVSIIAITSTVYFVPTPGNAGAAEGSFFLVFSSLSSGYVFWAMLFWRVFTYYAYIGIGVITMLSMYLSDKKILEHFKKIEEAE